ncbi:MAG: phosphoribosylglycinamide formyltransferase [Pseudomonadales bacterium]
MTPTILVIISGSGTNLQAIIDGCNNGKINGKISAVISNVPGVKGLERARNAGIEAITLDHHKFDSRQQYDQSLAVLIDQYQPDLVVLAGFMRILTPDFVNQYLGRLINIHPSLLPKYQGLHTHQRALEAGDKKHGATVHFVTPELDGGPPIVQGEVAIFPDDTESSLAKRVQLQVEHHIYPLAIDWCLRKRVQLTESGVTLDGELLPARGFQYRVKPE